MKTAHTPTPWVQIIQGYIDTMDGEPIAETINYRRNSRETNLANAAHIVKCVNMHDELVKFVDKITHYDLKFLNEPDRVRLALEAKDLLSRARGES